MLMAYFQNLKSAALVADSGTDIIPTISPFPTLISQWHPVSEIVADAADDDSY